MTFSNSKVLNAIGEKSANVRQQIPLITNRPKASPEINIFSINTDSDSVGSREKLNCSNEVVATDSKAEFRDSRAKWCVSEDGIITTTSSCLVKYSILLPILRVFDKDLGFGVAYALGPETGANKQ